MLEVIFVESGIAKAINRKIARLVLRIEGGEIGNIDE
jgi:hypothetical protein